MKKFENLGRSLSKKEQKNIMGGDAPIQTCGTVCHNCVALSINCSGDCTPNDHGIWCNGSYYPCPSGNYCS